MKRTDLPLLTMLIAGVVTCIITMVNGYDVLTKLIIMLAVMVLFYVFGIILKSTLDYFEAENEKLLMEQGEVIEKGPEENEGLQDSIYEEAERETVES